MNCYDPVLFPVYVETCSSETKVYRILGSHNGVFEEFSVAGYDTV
jgi:hypothetical protein